MPVSDSDGLYLAGRSFRETSGYSRAIRESLPTSACNTKKTPAEGLRQVARSKGFDEASGGVRYRRCECARRAGQVGCAVARPVSKQSRTLAHQAGANVVDAHGVRRTSHVPVRNRREREPRATLMRAANPPLACPAAVRRLHAIQVAGRSRIHPRPAAACAPPTPHDFRKFPRQYRTASPLWEMPLPDSKPTIDHRASGTDGIRTSGQARHSESKSTHAHAVY